MNIKKNLRTRLIAHFFRFLEFYPWVGDLLALLAGSLLVLAFAPFNLFPIAILSITALFLLWKSCTPLRALWRGWLFGVGMFGFGVYWLHISLLQFGAMSFVSAIIVNALFVMLMALYPAFLGWFILKVFPVCNKVRLLAALPAAWTLLEWFRSWFLSGFPWLSLGYSQLDAPLAGWAPLMGVYGVSWAVAFSGSLLVYAFLGGRQAWPAWPALLLVWGLGGLLTQASWTRSLEEPINVAMIQGNTVPDIKFDPIHTQTILDTYLRLSQQHRDADLIIWPETAVPVFYHEAIGLFEALTEEAKQYDSHFLIGVPVMDPDTGAYYNSVLGLSAESSDFYYKQHLVPFGEYMPFRGLIENQLKFIQIPLSDFTPGPPDQPLIKAGRHSIGISICYEDAFPDEIRRVLSNATLLVNVSNDSWFGDSIAPHQHLQIARMRALEAGRYLLRATNTGVSAVIDDRGNIVSQVPQFEEGVVTAQAMPFDGGTPYGLSGNTPLLFIMFVSLMVGIVLHHYWYPAHHPKPV